MIGELISGGAKLIGGLLGQSSQNEANDLAVQQAEQNRLMQEKFARNAIQWKVADAKDAGIHPLYALGASTASYAPVSVGVSGASPLASAVSDFGTNLGRAVSANRSDADRVSGAAAAQQLKSNELDLENKALQNQLLRSKLVNATQPGTPPGVPSWPEPGVAGTGEFTHPEDKPEKTPPLLNPLNGRRWWTDPNISPMKAYEDRYGDDGPASWILPWFIGAADVQKNYGPVSAWPSQLLRAAYRAAKDDIINEGRNARNFARKLGNFNVGTDVGRRW